MITHPLGRPDVHKGGMCVYSKMQPEKHPSVFKPADL